MVLSIMEKKIKQDRGKLWSGQGINRVVTEDPKGKMTFAQTLKVVRL